MMVLTNEGGSVEIPFHSPILDSTTTKYSSRTINEIKHLRDGSLLSSAAIDFMFVMKLDYLLFNYNLRYTTDNPKIKEIETIKEEPVFEVRLHKLLKRFWGYEDYLQINLNQKINLQLVISLKLTNVLDYLYRRGVLRYISPLVDEACKYGHLEILEWFHSNGLLEYSYLSVDNAAENGYLEVIEWFYDLSMEKGYKFKYKDAVYLSEQNGHLHVVEWFRNKLECY